MTNKHIDELNVLISSSTTQELIEIDQVNMLFNTQDNLWFAIVHTLKDDARRFEKLLFRLHLQRESNYSKTENELILKFLSIAYILTADVRYFNEFCWFNKDQNHPYVQLVNGKFRKELIDGIHHSFPLGNRESCIKHIENSQFCKNNTEEKPRIISTALLGAPYSFSLLYSQLRHSGFNPGIFRFADSEQSWLRQQVKSTPVLFKIYCLLRGCTLPYETINLKHNDPQLTQYFSYRKYNLAIHHLGVIIRKNLIDSFELGILNDHLAVLPYVRGRSSVEYSLLFGFPVGATIHLIDEGVDTGKLISIYTYNDKQLHNKSINQIKEMILKDSDFRFLDTVKYMAAQDHVLLPNRYEDGLQYYTMHPSLISYIEEKVLPKLH